MRHRAEVAHHVKGRMRLKVPSAKGNAAALEHIRKTLSPVKGVHKVEVNHSTGSVTVHYDPAQHDDFHAHLAGEGEHREAVHVPRSPKITEVDELVEMWEKEAEYLSGHSHTAKVIVDGLKSLDQGVKRLTNNAIDLKVATPLALAVFAFTELGIHAATPVWVTLGLFSFNHFIEMHSPDAEGGGPAAPTGKKKLFP